MVDKDLLFGKELRTRLFHDCSRQFALDFLLEQLPDSSNRITIDPNVRTPRGDLRPIVTYQIDDYVKAGAAAAYEVGIAIMNRFGATNFTTYQADDPGAFTYGEKTYVYQGAGHNMGSHRMGTSPSDSVVDRRQRTWDHPNLYLVGCGNFPTMATSNPTLTLSALALMAADNILADTRS
jgi:choline dehydrogenase-like flavoprotein